MRIIYLRTNCSDRQRCPGKVLGRVHRISGLQLPCSQRELVVGEVLVEGCHSASLIIDKIETISHVTHIFVTFLNNLEVQPKRLVMQCTLNGFIGH